MTETKVKKLTDWEAGQELIKAHDAIAEAAAEVRDSHPEHCQVLFKALAIVGDLFNEKHVESHGFGLDGTQSLFGKKDPSNG